MKVCLIQIIGSKKRWLVRAEEIGYENEYYFARRPCKIIDEHETDVDVDVDTEYDVSRYFHD